MSHNIQGLFLFVCLSVLFCFCFFEEPNSGPHAYKVNTLLTKQSPQYPEDVVLGRMP